MSIGEWIGIIFSVTGIIGFVSWISYRLIRSEMKDEFTPKFEALDEKIKKLDTKITDEDKKSIKYMGEACQYKLDEYEEKKEELRQTRSEKYMGTIEMIKDSIKRNNEQNEKNTAVILRGLENIKEQIQSNAIVVSKHDLRIDQLEKAKK